MDRPVLTPEVGATGWWIDSHVARDRYAGIGCAVAGDMIEWFRKHLGFEEAERAKTEGGVCWSRTSASPRNTPSDSKPSSGCIRRCKKSMRS